MPMFCTRCGTNNETNARFCRQCASPLGAAPAPSDKPNEAPYPGYQGAQNPGFQGQPPSSYQPMPGSLASSYAPQSYPNAARGNSNRAIAALVLMILSFFTCGPLMSMKYSFNS